MNSIKREHSFLYIRKKIISLPVVLMIKIIQRLVKVAIFDTAFETFETFQTLILPDTSNGDKQCKKQPFERGFMCAHVLLNSLNELGKRVKMRSLPSI